MTSALPELAPASLRDDVYFRDDFLRLHAAPDEVDRLEMEGFIHGAAIRPIPGTDLADLETPWGYGGPLGLDAASLADGIATWRCRQAEAGRVAELVRLHPFLDAAALRPHFDRLEANRETVIVDLTVPADARRAGYSKGTRYSLRQAEKAVTLRRLAAGEGELFRTLYEAGLQRNQAATGYYLGPAAFDGMLAAPWCAVWVAERDGEPIAVAAFLHGGPLCHYHLSGGTADARDTFAHYLLLENAFEHYAAGGCAMMHLGGGRGSAADDPLLAFKGKFSPLRLTFHVGGLVHDRDAFARLPEVSPGRILPYRS